MTYKVDAEDLVIFADEDHDNGENPKQKEKWKILIVDDEQEIHQITKMVLQDFEYDGKGLEFLSAYTEQETKQLMEENSDTAVILLDVVMENDHSGLNLVQYIREELKNTLVRIVLRTGQPGQAPEQKIIMDYDINDYKEKAELTVQKLYTTMVAALRSYRDLNVIENNKNGLIEIIKSSSSIFQIQSMQKFASGVLTQLASILNLTRNAVHCNSFALTKGIEEIYILAGTGEYQNKENQNIKVALSSEVLQRIERAFVHKESQFYDNHFLCYFQSKSGIENVIYFEGVSKLNEWSRYLIEIYCTNVSIAFENIYLNEEVENTQKEIIFTLGEIAETRSKETGYHVKRVAEYTKLLALKYGLPEEEAEMLRMASPMHDIGKVAIPDAILNKPGKLTQEEYEVMKGHSNIGYSMLKHSNRNLLRTAAIIAEQHHEKYNGSGYPNGLAGDEIHLYGRIAAVADVFDALSSERVYKKAWSMEEIIEYFSHERGKHFDPTLVDIFLDHLDEFLAIKEKYMDTKVF